MADRSDRNGFLCAGARGTKRLFVAVTIEELTTLEVLSLRAPALTPLLRRIRRAQNGAVK